MACMGINIMYDYPAISVLLNRLKTQGVYAPIRKHFNLVGSESWA